MGNYEEAYKKYYSETKAKFKIKENSKNKVDLYSEKSTSDNSIDIYPNKNNDFDRYNIYSNVKNYNCEVVDKGRIYNGGGTYNGIDNYNNLNFNRSRGDNNIRFYNGYNFSNNLNNKIEEKTLIGKWVNRIIIELGLTFILLILVVGLKNLPFEQTKSAYYLCKEVVSKDFNYKSFLEEVDVMEEIDKLKVNLKIDEDIDNKNGDLKNTQDVTTEKIDKNIIE